MAVAVLFSFSSLRLPDFGSRLGFGFGMGMGIDITLRFVLRTTWLAVTRLCI
jgi:hypothetical protein